MTGYWTDCRQSLRLLVRRRGVTTTAVLTLALGIGATTTIFSIVDAALLRPLPWPDADRLVAIHAVWPERQTDPAYAASWDRSPIAWPMWQEIRQTPAFDDIGVWTLPPAQILVGPQEDLVSVMEASSSLLTLVGAQAAVGRLFTREEDAGTRVALLSHEAWHRYFSGRDDIVGQIVSVRPASSTGNAPTSFEVVGVLAPDVRFYRESPEIITPVGWRGDGAIYASVRAVGRLAAGTTSTQAAAVVEPIVRTLALPDLQTARVVPLREDLRGGSQQPLWLLFGGAGLLLLVACSSVAGLLIGDARTRSHEIAVHATLGATRRRILRQLAIEHLALAGLAALLGIGLAALVGPVTLAAAPLGSLDADVPALSSRVAAFALVAGFATPILFGLAPFLIMSQVQPSRTLAIGESRQTFRRGASHGATVAVQVALALVLVTGAAMFGETVIRLTSRPLGFDPANVAIATLARMRPVPMELPVELRAPGGDVIRARELIETQLVRGEAMQIDRVLERVSTLPSVVMAAGVRAAPFTGQPNRYSVRPSDLPQEDEQPVDYQYVTESYFDTMRIPMLRGRAFGPEDRQGRWVAVVSDELERRLFAGDAVGRQIARGESPIVLEIVGVAANVKQRTFAEEELPVVYLPHWQAAGIRQLLVRTSGNPADVLPHVRQAVQEAGPDLVVTSTTTMEGQVAATTRDERFRALLSLVFGLAALVLAAVGLYGLTARQVVERRREIGVRTALGARPGQVRALMLRQACVALVLGLAIGAPIAYAVSHLAQSLLFGVSPTDPRLLLTSCGVLAAVALAATLLPAHRASRIDPSVTLRE